MLFDGKDTSGSAEPAPASVHTARAPQPRRSGALFGGQLDAAALQTGFSPASRADDTPERDTPGTAANPRTARTRAATAPAPAAA